jgi:spore coat polysaccharide biosynthesis protein SpsF
MKQVTAIIQARMGSSRLPGKVLIDIVGHSMLWHIVQRVQIATSIDKIIIATTINPEDEIIEHFARENNIDCFRGNQEDVLDRFYKTALYFKIKNIVRITADDPFIDPIIINKVVNTYLNSNVDYVSNTIEETYPLGLNVEIFSFFALEQAFKKAKKPYEREHVTPYIWGQPKKFSLVNVEYESKNLSHMRWTLDTKEDLEFVRTIYKNFYMKKKEIFFMDDILRILKEHPDIFKINEHVKQKSLC